MQTNDDPIVNELQRLGDRPCQEIREAAVLLAQHLRLDRKQLCQGIATVFTGRGGPPLTIKVDAILRLIEGTD